MKFILFLTIFCIPYAFAQYSPEVEQYNQQMKKQYDEQIRMKREMDQMRQKDLYLKSLDSTLQGMEAVSKDKTKKTNAKTAEMVSKLKVGKGNYKVFVQDQKNLKRHEFNMLLGGSEEKYSCFYTKTKPISFHTVAMDPKENTEIKFDLTNIGQKDEKLSVFVKGRNIDATFEVPSSKFRRTQTLKEGNIKIIKDLKNEAEIILKSNSMVSFKGCAEVDINTTSSAPSPSGYPSEGQIRGY